MEKILSKIYYSIKGYKRFHVFANSGIHAEIIVSNEIYINWRTFGKRPPDMYYFRINMYKKIILVNKETSEIIESTIFLTEKFKNCSRLLEYKNFLTYFLKKSIENNNNPIVVL